MRSGKAVPTDTCRTVECGLTLRSRRGPTAGCQAPRGGEAYHLPRGAWHPTVGPASPQTVGCRGMQIRALTPKDAAAFAALRLRGLQECPEAFASSYEEEVN